MPGQNHVCNFYSIVKGPEAICRMVPAARVNLIDFVPQPGVYPDYAAPIVHNTLSGPTLARARWGMPSPGLALGARRLDPGITTIRNVRSAHWIRWLDVRYRCLVPFTSFSVNDAYTASSRSNAWFALDVSRPLGFFAGIWAPKWTSQRKIKEGETTNDLFAFLTADPNKEVEAIHPKEMPTILLTQQEIDCWLNAPAREALELQRPLPDGTLQIVARGVRKDGEQEKPHTEARLAWRRNPAHAGVSGS